MRQCSVFDNCGFELVLIFIAVLNAVTNDPTETSPALSRVFLQQSTAEGTLDERFVLIEVGVREYQMCQARVRLRRAPAESPDGHRVRSCFTTRDAPFSNPPHSGCLPRRPTITIEILRAITPPESPRAWPGAIAAPLLRARGRHTTYSVSAQTLSTSSETYGVCESKQAFCHWP
jgi:hypothetical protein